MELFFDTETSGLFNFKNPNYTTKNFPWCVQLGAVLAEDGVAYGELNLIIKAGGRSISPGAAKVHNISVELSEKVGIEERLVGNLFNNLIKSADTLICHNYQFDSMIIAGLFHRLGYSLEIDKLFQKPFFCTMKETVDLCKLPGKFGTFKWPKLQELHNYLFGENFTGAHDAMFDIKATMKCYYELKRIGWIE